MNTEPHERPVPRTLIACFTGLPDPRIDRTRWHKLIDILVIGLCSQLTGGEGFTDMAVFGKAKRDWLKTFLELPRGIPSHDTFNRVFSALDPHCFLECFVQWVQAICPALAGGVVAIDGKALRRALNDGASIPYIVSAWASENGLVLGQVKVEDKSNEITAIPELLRVLELSGCIVTIDAMGCQKEIAARIADKNADYVLALKGNHATAHEEIQEFFSDAVARVQRKPPPPPPREPSTSSRRWKRTTEELKRAAIGNPPILSGLPTKGSGRNYTAWAWSNHSAALREKPPSNADTICAACRWTLKRSPRPSADIGASRILCIGRSMLRSVKIKAGPVQKMRRRTSRPCADWHSISPRLTPPRRIPSEENACVLHSIPSFYSVCWDFRCVCPGCRAGLTHLIMLKAGNS